MHRLFLRMGTLAVAGLLVSEVVAAQTPAPATGTAGPASVSVIGGLSAGAHQAGAALGGTITFDLNDRLAIEGSGAYLDRGPGADAISANATLLVNLRPAAHSMVPYLGIGGGVYRASFDLGNTRMFGGLNAQFRPGTQVVPLGSMHGGFGMMRGFTGPTWTGPWSGPTFVAGSMPGFYAQRMGVMTVPADGRWGRRTFTDPAITFSGGVILNVTNTLFVRPDLRALVIVGGGDTYTVGVFSMSFGYRF